jgi:hypothetical protein
MIDRETPHDRVSDVEEERRLAGILSQAGSRTAPSEAQLERWAGRFRATLADARAEKRRRWQIRAAGIAASISAVVAVLFMMQAPDLPVAAGIADVYSVSGGNSVDGAQGTQRGLVPGERLNVGDRLRTGLRGGLGMKYRGADVRIGRDTEVIVHTTRLELVSGVVYVDTGAAGSAQTDVVVATRLGSVTHLGTQYLVQLDSDRLVSAVREGQIIFRSEQQKRQLSADASTAGEIRVAQDGSVTESRKPRSGEQWDWAVEISPGISLTGRSPDEVLTWAARESGRTLKYADEKAAAVAREGRLAGTDAKIPSPEVLAAVEASTRLRFLPSDSATLLVGLGKL